MKLISSPWLGIAVNQLYNPSCAQLGRISQEIYSLACQPTNFLVSSDALVGYLDEVI